MSRLGIRLRGERLDENISVFAARLDEARDVGFEAIELNPTDFDLIIAGNLVDHRVQALHELLGGFNFALSLHAPLRLNLMNREYPDMHRRVLEACFDLCTRLSAGLLVVHPGRVVDNCEFFRYGKPDIDAPGIDTLRDRENRIIREFAARYPAVTLVLENHRPYAVYSPYSHAEFPDRLLAQIQSIDMPNVRINLDTGHLNLAAAYYGFDPIAAVIPLKSRIAHMHIQDNHGIPSFHTDKDKRGMLPFGSGDEHLLPGDGSFPFADLLKAVQPYRGIYLAEISTDYLYRARLIETFERMSRMTAACAE